MSKPLKLYLDQMIQAHVAKLLQEKGYDVVRASETGQARADGKQVLERAASEDRILITLDDHFGDWVILPLSRHPGVIRIKTTPTTSKNIIDTLLPLLVQYHAHEFRNHLIIASQSVTRWVKTAENPGNVV